VKVPEGWARTDAGSGVTSFSDKLNSVRMQSTAAKVAPTASEARRTDLPMLAKTAPGFKAGTISTVNRTAGKALRITYLAQSPADAVTGKSHTTAVERYIFFHNGKTVVLTLSAPKGADNVDPWKIVTNSVRFTR
jgi:hypothetical protein